MDDYGKYKMVSNIKVNRSSQKPSEKEESGCLGTLVWLGVIAIIRILLEIIKA